MSIEKCQPRNPCPERFHGVGADVAKATCLPPVPPLDRPAGAVDKFQVFKTDTKVRAIGNRYLAIDLTPNLVAYFDIDEAVALRAQLDAEIARMSERLL